jgi:hypothetical protein
MRRSVILATIWCTFAAGAGAGSMPVTNASFEDGTDAPLHWSLSGGRGTWRRNAAAEGKRCVSVTGSGKDDNHWLSAPVALKAGALYQVTFMARGAGTTGGTPVTGPLFCNRDIRTAPAEWTRFSSVFATPDTLTPERARLRFGQWHVKGTVCFDDIRVSPVQAVHAAGDGLTLGEGETLKGNRYRFAAPFRSLSRNSSRPLATVRCDFNTDRWTFGTESEVVYRHALDGREIAAAEIDASVTWHGSGQLAMSVGTNGVTWQKAGGQHGLGTLSTRVPEGLLPAKALWVRLKAVPADATSRRASLQVGGYAVQATVTGAPADHTGRTRFVRVDSATEGLDVTVEDLGDGLPGGRNAVLLRIDNTGAGPITVVPETAVGDGAGEETSTRGDSVVLNPGQTQIQLPYDLPGTGDWTLSFSLGDRFAASAEIRVPDFYDTSYGERLPGSSDALTLWHASSGWKIPRTRALPKAEGKAVRISAAQGETEAAQLVLHPRRALQDVTLVVSPLTGSRGTTLRADHIEVLRVRYVSVTHPTDSTGVVAPWPDPLPPLRAPLDLEAGVNQPLWIRANVPRGTRKDDYAGTISILSAGELVASAPLRVRVYGFELPLTMTCQTAFGVRTSAIFKYHGVTDPGQRRKLLWKYWDNYSKHHVSPYNPAPLDPFEVSWPALSDWDGGQRDRQTRHGGKSALLLRDTNRHAQVSARYGKQVRIPDSGLKLSFWYKTERPGHETIVTFNHEDGDGTWMSGRNNDMRFAGDGSWQRFERTITAFPKEACSLRLTLWPTLYREDGSTTGTVWYDDLTLADAGTGEALVSGGAFEPVAADRLRPLFDWSVWDGAMERAINRYHFNTFRMPIRGLGGGTFHARYAPNLLGFGEGTPEYKAAFGAYLRGIQEHLGGKGWLDEAFVYWFDEPDPKDYAFVNNGFRKLKEHAPGLRRMLTEQVEDELIGGPTIWCPVSHHYDHDRAEARRQQGEDFWWYVCTGPKAPYCTLFIDHPATEMRVWLWQTWQRGIKGILVWETTYWTSGAAYPDPAHPQNPYEDPMGWVSGYSTPKGTRRPWGNGDGRFVYPPEAAADGRPGRAVMEGPVDSIRWEMLRDGIEDYEYMVILRNLLQAKRNRLRPPMQVKLARLLEVPPEVTTDMTHFTTDPAPLEKHRNAVAEAIELLTQI